MTGSTLKIIGNNIEITSHYLSNAAIRNEGNAEISGNILIQNTAPNAYNVIDNWATGVLKISGNVIVTGQCAGSSLVNMGTLNMTGGSVINTKSGSYWYAINNTGTATITSNVITQPENSGTITIID